MIKKCDMCGKEISTVRFDVIITSADETYSVCADCVQKIATMLERKES